MSERACTAATAVPEDVLREEHLPSLPAVAMRILELSRDDDAGLSEYAEAISADPALTAKVLRQSNSASFGLANEVTTLQQATSVLGLRTISMLALGFSLARAFPGKDEESSVPLKEFWKRSLLGAVAGREFGRLCGAPFCDEAFLCGLLSQVGVFVTANALPDCFTEICSETGGWPTRDVERQVLGFDASDLSEALMRRWGMPSLIREGVVRWSNPEHVCDDTDRRFESMAPVVAISACAVNVLCDEPKGEALGRLHELADEQGLTREQADTVLLTLELRARQMAEFLEIDPAEGPSHYAILDEARQQLVRASVETSVAFEGAEKRIKRLQADLRHVIDRSQRDELTGLRNRGAFKEALAAEISKRMDRSAPGVLGLLMIDIDNFKAVNDTHGHPIGDEILHWVGHAILASCRDSDTAARIGGDEFAIIVPSTTIVGLEAFGERIRSVLSRVKVPVASRTHTVTVSVGAASLEKANSLDDGRELIAAADEFLYKAKAAGRNRAAVSPASVSTA